MAVFNEVLEGGLNKLLTRRLAMQTGSPAPAVQPELVPGLVLENDRLEYSWAKGELLASGRVGAGAVAGQFGFAQLTNPAGSGIIATVTGIQWQFGASNGFLKIRVSGATGGPVVASVRDSRWIQEGNTTARPTCGITGGTAAAASPEPVLDYLGPTNPLSRDDGWILRPGTCLWIELEVANIVLASTTFVWRERVASPGELA